VLDSIFLVCIGGMDSSVVYHGYSPDQVKPNTIKLVFVASPLSMQN